MKQVYILLNHFTFFSTSEQKLIRRNLFVKTAALSTLVAVGLRFK